MADAYLALRRMHVFTQLDEKALRAIAPHFEEKVFKANEVIFTEGDISDYFYTIATGQVEVLVDFKSSKPRRLSLLNEADYFGEMGLAKNSTRNATVRAIKDTTVWRIANQHFRTLMYNNPKVKKALEIAIRTREYARQEKFHKWLRDGEIVYLVTLQHQNFLYPMLVRPLGVMFASIILAAVVFYFGFSFWWQFIPLLVLLSGIGWFRWNWVDFHNDWYIVTSQRVIDIDKIVLFYESRAEAPIGTVQNTTINTDEWGRQFDYGDVTVSTFSGPIKFHNIPHPQAVADLVLEQINRAKIQQKVAERNILKGSLRQAMGLDKAAAAPPPPPPAPKKAPTLKDQWNNFRKQIVFKLREQQGDTVTYRKHLIMLVEEISTQLAAVAALLIISIFFLINLFTQWIPFVTGGVTAIIISLCTLIFIGLFIKIAYEYVDWRNDIYMVTNTQIFDIERKPFGAEQRKSANIEAVSNVSYQRADFWGYVFNFGTVTINAGPGGEMKFFNVFDPLAVQQDIYRRKEAREAAKAVAAAKARHEEYALYFGAFYEVLEDERKKRDQEEKQKKEQGGKA